MFCQAASPAVLEAFCEEAKGKGGSTPTGSDPPTFLDLTCNICSSSCWWPRKKAPDSRNLVAVFSSAMASSHLPALTLEEKFVGNENVSHQVGPSLPGCDCQGCRFLARLLHNKQMQISSKAMVVTKLLVRIVFQTIQIRNQKKWQEKVLVGPTSASQVNLCSLWICSIRSAIPANN